ncbi:MAG: DUF533 domain-containing protein [Pseudomonadota bacterium]
MFDARKLLEAIVGGGTQPHMTPDQRNAMPAGQAGSVGDLLGRLGGGNAQPGGAGGDGQSIEDLLRNLMPGNQGGMAPTQAPNISAPEAGAGATPTSGGDGGLGDLLGRLGQGGGSGGGGGAGSITDVLGQVFGQATSGVKEGSERIGEATGIDDLIRQISGGQSGGDMMAKIKDLIANNQVAAGAGLGGLGALILGTRTGRGLALDAAKVGGLVLIGGLAYKAYQNYQAGKPLIDTARSDTQTAPSGSGFEADAVSHDSALLYIRAMIAAAAADGRVDGSEQQKILGGLQQAGLDASAEEFLARELNNPAAISELAASCRNHEERVQMFTAARLAVDLDDEAESTFLVELAEALNLEPDLARHIDAAARGAPTDI